MLDDEAAAATVTPPVSVAVVDDDPTARRLMRFWLERAGYSVVEHESARSVLDHDGETPALACVDLGLGEVTGIKVIQHLRARDSELPIIVVTAQRELETAVAAMQAGAYDYVTKPLDRDRLLLAVHRANERRELLSNVRRLESALTERSVLGSIVGKSPPMRELAQQVKRVLESDVAVCVFGESGTGKELVARAIHTGSVRRRGPFVAINCAGIPESLQESELFGHERGAFTGATQQRRGCFEQANGGTLLLDELGEMSMQTQASLLRTIQEKTIRRVGGSSEIPIDVRIVCATHRDLRAEVEAGRFREDLYFRLVVYPIHLPALRERIEDIPTLVGHFLRSLSKDVGRDVQSISPEALEALGRHHWPGNVRELQNVVHRSLLACRGEEVTLADLPPDIRELALPAILPTVHVNGANGNRYQEPSEEDIIPLRELERRAIQRALRATHGSVGRAAKLLGIGRATLYRRIATLDLSRDVA
ncbi:MAG TPA: sigma-54 dependent transcriptional regulator [Polyangiaceae bacterium]|nr:sigma-54 dependent transcriptional regulator [Polyangiaceae bacterium]